MRNYIISPKQIDDKEMITLTQPIFHRELIQSCHCSNVQEFFLIESSIDIHVLTDKNHQRDPSGKTHRTAKPRLWMRNTMSTNAH